MATKTNTKWLAVGLYYSEPWEELLVKAVKPYVEVVLQTGVAECFFYTRNWDKGPNVRLWFKGNAYILAKMLRPNLDEHFQHYFESRPSTTTPPKYPGDYPDDYKWHPNNSIQYANYNPALDLSGGLIELSIMEKQYQASSLLVLKTLREKADRWSYNEMISTAMKIHLGLAYAVGMDLQEANDFFRYLSNNWFANKYPVQRSEQRQVELSFAKIFSMQRKDVVPYHKAVWELLRRYESMEDQQFIHWIRSNAHLNMELSMALEQEKLRLKKPALATPGEYPAQWDFFEPLVRLTNNRLGIFNKNEGYLFYVMAESLKLSVADPLRYHHQEVGN